MDTVSNHLEFNAPLDIETEVKVKLDQVNGKIFGQIHVFLLSIALIDLMHRKFFDE